MNPGKPGRMGKESSWIRAVFAALRRAREHRALIQRAIPAYRDQKASFDVRSIGINVTTDFSFVVFQAELSKNANFSSSKAFLER